MVPQKCIDLVKAFEGCELKAYRDSAGIPTIGYGHIRGVRMGDTCTLEQATKWLTEELEASARDVLNLVKVQLNENEFSAIISAQYNAGLLSSHGGPSTLRKLLNAGDKKGAAAQFDNWVYAGKQRIQGLVNRRRSEKELFLAPVV